MSNAPLKPKGSIRQIQGNLFKKTNSPNKTKKKELHTPKNSTRPAPFSWFDLSGDNLMSGKPLSSIPTENFGDLDELSAGVFCLSHRHHSSCIESCKTLG